MSFETRPPVQIPKLSPPANQGRRVFNVVALLMMLLLPLSGSIGAANSAPAPDFRPGASGDRPAQKPRVSLTLKKAQVTTQQTGRGTVAVSASRAALRHQPFGKVRLVMKNGDQVRRVHAAMDDPTTEVTLPRLAEGTYRVQAVFLGNQALRTARSGYENLTVVAADDGGTPPVDGGGGGSTPPPGDGGGGTPSGFPDASNTGVPAGTELTSYNGSCTISTANTVIDSKTIDCSELLVQASDVTIRNSKINGRILVDTDVNRSWSLTLTDSEVDAGPVDSAAIANGNVTIERTDIHGGHNGLECQEHASYCAIKDSWIHDQWQPSSGEAHLGGLLALGTQVPCTGTNGACVEIVHNTIVCDARVTPQGGGCTGDINLLPHWGPLTGAIVEGNYLGANDNAAYCTFAGAGMEYPATNVVYRDNVFERGSNNKCADYGPVTNFDSSARGNVWTNNTWDDGTPVPAAR
ncbi:MAG TPA: hypothetical protein VFT70_01875 [Nocardioides sp.]|nr:hypothetical protein [Nocardioides sp.]